MLGAGPKPHAGSSDGDTSIDFLSEVVAWSVLVWFTRQRGMENWVCDGVIFFRGAADGLLWTRSTIEVVHFRYFVSERWGSLSPNRWNVNLDFETNVL